MSLMILNTCSTLQRTADFLYSIYGTDGTDLDGSAVNDTTIDQLNSYLTELADGVL